MTITDLASLLRASDPSGKEHLELIDRLVAAATACASFQEIERELPPKARYIGPGPWLDAILSSAKGVQEGE